MRISLIKTDKGKVLAARRGDDLVDLNKVQKGLGTDLSVILAKNGLRGLKKKIKDAPKSAVVKGSYKYLCPIERPPKIICVGLNYADHAKESPYEKPTYPVLFLRVTTSLVPHGGALIAPKASEQFDYEGEMVAIIGKAGRHISRADALKHVAGYSVFNDGSVRDYQFKSAQWTSGKNFDGSGGFGPEFVTADEVPDPQNLDVKLWVNGELRQSFNTSDMAHKIPRAIEWVSAMHTLNPGDILATGTNHGGLSSLMDGDQVVLECEKCGKLEVSVRDDLKRKWPSITRLQGGDRMKVSAQISGKYAPGS